MNIAFVIAFQVNRKLFAVFVLNTDRQVGGPFRQLNQQSEQCIVAIIREVVLFRETLNELIDDSIRPLTRPVFTHRNRAWAEAVRFERFLFMGAGKLARRCCFQHGYFLIATWRLGASVRGRPPGDAKNPNVLQAQKQTAETGRKQLTAILLTKRQGSGAKNGSEASSCRPLQGRRSSNEDGSL
nr:hypothetical protein [Pseudomonas syringae]